MQHGIFHLGAPQRFSKSKLLASTIASRCNRSTPTKGLWSVDNHVDGINPKFIGWVNGSAAITTIRRICVARFQKHTEGQRDVADIPGTDSYTRPAFIYWFRRSFAVQTRVPLLPVAATPALPDKETRIRPMITSAAVRRYNQLL